MSCLALIFLIKRLPSRPGGEPRILWFSFNAVPYITRLLPLWPILYNCPRQQKIGELLHLFLCLTLDSFIEALGSCSLCVFDDHDLIPISLHFKGLPVVVTSPPQHSKSVFTSPTQKTDTTSSASASASRTSTGGVRSSARVSSSRKASSTPSLPEATTESAKPLEQSFEQTVSADNLSAKQVSVRFLWAFAVLIKFRFNTGTSALLTYEIENVVHYSHL